MDSIDKFRKMFKKTESPKDVEKTKLDSHLHQGATGQILISNTTIPSHIYTTATVSSLGSGYTPSIASTLYGNVLTGGTAIQSPVPPYILKYHNQITGKEIVHVTNEGNRIELQRIAGNSFISV